MRRGKTYPLGAYQYDGFVKCYETTLTGAATSVSITGLNGNVDVEYILIGRMVSMGVNSTFKIAINNDTTTSHYGLQRLTGSNSTISAVRDTDSDYLVWMCLQGGSNLGDVAMGAIRIYAKSGYVRTTLNEDVSNINGTTITYLTLGGFSWNDTSTNITSLVISGDGTGNIGIGTYIALYKRVYST